MSTITIQPTSNSETKSTNIIQLLPTLNNFAYLSIQAYSNTPAYIKRPLLYFDVSPIAGCLINSATLTLYLKGVVGAGTFNVEVHELTRAFTSLANWNTYDGSNAWSSAGGDFGSSLVSTSISTVGSYSWSIPVATVMGWYITNYGILLKSDNENQSINDRNFANSEDPTEASRPKLVIDYIPQLRGRKRSRFNLFDVSLS